MQQQAYSPVSRSHQKEVDIHAMGRGLWRGIVFTAVTLVAIALCGASVFIALMAVSRTPNGAYKAVAIFLAVILDSNILSIYLRWVLAF